MLTHIVHGTEKTVKDMFWAAIEGDVRCLRSCIEMGEDINSMGQPSKTWGYRFEKSSGFKATPLHYAVSYGRELAVKLLLEHGARLDIKSHSGLTAKDYAQIRGYTDIQLLLEIAAEESR